MSIDRRQVQLQVSLRYPGGERGGQDIDPLSPSDLFDTSVCEVPPGRDVSSLC